MMGNPADFWKRLAERGMDEAAFLRMVRKDVTVDQMSALKLAELPEPSEAEIRRFFAAHPEKLREQARVRASHILLPVDPDDPETSKRQAEALEPSRASNRQRSRRIKATRQEYDGSHRPGSLPQSSL